MHECSERLQRCAAHVRYIDDMWNGHLDALQRPNREIPDRGSVLKNNQFAVPRNILSVVGVFLGHSVYITNYLAFKELGVSLLPLHKLTIGPYLQQDLSILQDHNPPPSNPF